MIGTAKPQRRTLVAAAMLGLAWLQSGCVFARDPGISVVLVDRSASIDPADRALYRQSLETLLASIKGGDRVLVGSIGEAGRGSWRVEIEAEVDVRSNPYDQTDAVNAVRRDVLAAFDALLARETRPARNTLILSAIAAAAQAFPDDPSKRANDRLVVLSDAVEDSDFINLSRPVDADRAAAALERAREAGVLPALTGIKAHFVGAGGQHYQQVESWWRGYSSAAGLVIMTYGRLPLSADKLAVEE